MKPDLKKMSRSELKEYIKSHRTDDEAIRELFINRRPANVQRYSFNMSDEEMKAVFQAKLQPKEQE